MQTLFRIFFPVLALQILLKSVKVWQSCSQMYTATFYESRQKCRFKFFQVRCTHKSGDVVNFNTVTGRISSRLKRCRNYKNRLRLAKVILKNKLPLFSGSLCIIEGRREGRLHAPIERSDKRKALKRTAEVRREWQRLLRAGTRTPASQQITSMNEWIAPCFVGCVMIYVAADGRPYGQTLRNDSISLCIPRWHRASTSMYSLTFRVRRFAVMSAPTANTRGAMLS